MGFSQNNGEFNGTTEVTIVDAPSSGTRTVKHITVYNADNANVTVTIRLEDGGTDRPICKITLEPDDTLIIDDPIVLKANDEYVKGVLSGAASPAPVFTAHYHDV